MYLKVLTWTEAGMDGNAIYGTLQDLLRLATIIDAKLQHTQPGSAPRIQREFAEVVSTPYCSMCEMKPSIQHPLILSYLREPGNPRLKLIARTLAKRLAFLVTT